MGGNQTTVIQVGAAGALTTVLFWVLGYFAPAFMATAPTGVEAAVTALVIALWGFFGPGADDVPAPPSNAAKSLFALLLVPVLLLGSIKAEAQTCPAAPADPIARDAARLNWAATTTWTQGGTIPVPPSVIYSVYELVGTTSTKRCETTALSAGQTGLSVGAHTWFVTAKHAGSSPSLIESAMSNTASKTIAAPPLTPSPPLTFTVAGEVTISGTLTLTPVVAPGG